MASKSHIEMHRQHAAWRSEDNLWREEIAIWERDVNQALKDLPRVEQAVRAHAETLKKHAAAVRLYEQDFGGHEHSLAEYERGETPLELIEQAQNHERELEQHMVQRKAHEDMKKRQHVFSAKWNLLLSALDLESPGPRFD
jgi:hypothetical protein